MRGLKAVITVLRGRMGARACVYCSALLLCTLIKATAQSEESNVPLELLPAGTPSLSAADTQALLPATSALLQAIKANPALSDFQDLSSWVPGLVTALTCDNATGTLPTIFPDLPINTIRPLLALLQQAASLLSKSSSSALQPSQQAPAAPVRHLTLTAAVFGTAAYLELLAANPWDDIGECTVLPPAHFATSSNRYTYARH